MGGIALLYYAHLAEDGRKQTVDQHETGTAILSAQFAKSFSAEDHGRLVGLSHDIENGQMPFRIAFMVGRKSTTLQQEPSNVPS